MNIRLPTPFAAGHSPLPPAPGEQANAGKEEARITEEQRAKLQHPDAYLSVVLCFDRLADGSGSCVSNRLVRQRWILDDREEYGITRARVFAAAWQAWRRIEAQYRHGDTLELPPAVEAALHAPQADQPALLRRIAAYIAPTPGESLSHEVWGSVAREVHD